MKKYFFLIISILTFFSACVKDDFCIENPVTPKLVILFYDDVNRDLTKRVDRLSVFVENELEKDSIYFETNTDSIAIPLDPTNFLSDEITSTTYIFRTEDETVTDKEVKLTISFLPKTDYVSRSCGFKIVFEDVNITTTEAAWVDEITPEDLTLIDNQNAAHVQIFH